MQAATVLTCGQLRLRVPPGARIPSVRMTPASAAVELVFDNFSGTVVFEPVHAAEHPAPQRQGKPPPPPRVPAKEVTRKPPADKFSRMPKNPTRDIPHNVQQPPLEQKKLPSHPDPRHLPTEQPVHLSSQTPPEPEQLSQHPSPLSHPIHMSQPMQLSQPIPMSQPINISHPIPLSQPMSPPLQLSQSIPFSLSQLPSQPLQSQPLFDPAFPASQLPDDSLTTCADRDASAVQSPPSPPPMAEQFAPNYMPLTPPSSDDDEDPLLDTDPYSPELHPAPVSAVKRNAPDFSLAVKTGKRVRFQSDPEIFSQSPLPASLEPQKERASEEENSPKQLQMTSKPSPWRKVEMDPNEPAPARRWGASFTRLDDETVVLLGGESELSGFFSGMAVLNVPERKWLKDGKDTPDMPNGGRAWHTTTCVDVNLFVFGGEKEINGERTQTNDAVMYDTTYFTWYPPALSGTPPTARAGHCAALVPGTKSIVIYGGINGNRWLNDLHLLEDLSTWSKVRVTNKSARPSARSYASLTAASGFLVLFGGNNKTRCFNDVHLLNAKDLSWVEPVILGRGPKARTGHCAVASSDGRSVVVYGGWDDQGAQRLFYSDVWELKIKSQTECQWACLFAGNNACRTPGPRAGAVLAAVGKEKKMLLFGGWHQFTYFNDVTELVLPFKRTGSGKSSLAA